MDGENTQIGNQKQLVMLKAKSEIITELERLEELIATRIAEANRKKPKTTGDSQNLTNRKEAR